MKVIYPALFYKDGDNYSVEFPDIPEAITCGSTINEAIDMAKECLGLCLDERKNNNIVFPKPSDPTTLNYKDNKFVMMIEFDSIEFNKKYNKKAIRKNVTIPAWLNDIAEENNVNFSNVYKML